MAFAITVDVLADYVTYRAASLSVRDAAAKAGMGYSSALSFEKGTNARLNMMLPLVQERGIQIAARDLAVLSPNAKRALQDFGYFRTRYFGRAAKPWAVMLANEVVAAMTRKSGDPDNKHFMVASVCPGSGKSSLMRDICIWLICRNRAIRIMWGSRTEKQAVKNVDLIRSILEHPGRLIVSDEMRRIRGSVDPTGSLVEDFGAFKTPKGGNVWARDGFTVMSPRNEQGLDKERTVSAYGLDSGLLGDRVDLALWDDLVDQRNYRVADAMEKLSEKWDTELENRIEPGGLVLLMGQRLNSGDLYRKCVSADASTITDRGLVPLRDVTTADRVLTRDGYKRVLWSGSQGIKDTLTLTTDLGRTLDLTPDHEVAVGGQWSRADALSAGTGLVGAPLGFDLGLVPGAELDASALPTRPRAISPKFGVLDRVGVAVVAVGAGRETSDVLGTPHVAAVVFADQVLQANTRRVPAQVASLATLGDRPTIQRELPQHHAGDKLFARKGPDGSLRVAGRVQALGPHSTLTLPSSAGSKPLLGDLGHPRVDPVAGNASAALPVDGRAAVDAVRSVTHGPMIETWDLTVEDTPEFYANGILVHNCLDKITVPVDEDGEVIEGAEPIPKYQHVKFQAHDESKCTGDHSPSKAIPWPLGCLLDPRAVSWREISSQMLNDPAKFAVVYQQEDGDFGTMLVQDSWIHGGQDTDGINYTGCVDRERVLGQYPVIPEGHKVLNIVSIDPSGTQRWGIIRAAIDLTDDIIHIVDLFNGALTVGQVLDRDQNLTGYSGLLEDWQLQSGRDGHRFTHVIFEQNTTQRWFMQWNHVRDWQRVRSVHVLPHSTTGSNKNDENRGIQMLRDYFRYGRIRIPYGDERTKNLCKNLIMEATRYPNYPTTDLMMSLWFLAHNKDKIVPRTTVVPRRDRPSWLRSVA